MASIPSMSPTLPITTSQKLFIITKVVPSFASLRSSTYSNSSFTSCSLSKKPKESSSTKRIYKNNGNGALFTFACSTSPFIGRVGWQRREGNSSLLYFGINNSNAEAATKTQADSSQLISAMLPFVVALTAVAALSQPSTFTWWVFQIRWLFSYFCTLLILGFVKGSNHD